MIFKKSEGFEISSVVIATLVCALAIIVVTMIEHHLSSRGVNVPKRYGSVWVVEVEGHLYLKNREGIAHAQHCHCHNMDMK